MRTRLPDMNDKQMEKMAFLERCLHCLHVVAERIEVIRATGRTSGRDIHITVNNWNRKNSVESIIACPIFDDRVSFLNLHFKRPNFADTTSPSHRSRTEKKRDKIGGKHGGRTTQRLYRPYKSIGLFFFSLLTELPSIMNYDTHGNC